MRKRKGLVKEWWRYSYRSKWRERRSVLDVAIIGGGPAGAAAALSLRQLMPEATIAIFDARRGEQWKPGETLSPGAAQLLQSLGCWPAFQKDNAALESFGTQAAWGTGDLYVRDFLYSLRGNGWRLDRARFDALLLDCAAAAGAEVGRRIALMDSTEVDGTWRLQLRGVECCARFVIDASGRSARFALQRGARPIAKDRLAGVFVLFETPHGGDTLIEAAENGWWYSTTVPGETAVVAWMSDTDCIREMRLKDSDCWRALLAQSTHTQHRFRGAVARGAPAIFAAHSQRMSRMGGRGWVAAGDAAMTFDPLSSQGILKALRSGKLASFVAADFLLRGVDTHERYTQLAVAEYDEYERAKRMFYGEERRWPAAPFWARRQAEPVTG